MRKRILAALCLGLALLCLASCGGGQLRVEVWRRTADAERALSEDVIQPETRAVQLQAGSINGAVSAFNAEPEDPDLSRAAPEGARIVGWQLKDGQLRLEVTPEWSELEGFDRTLADSCAVLTFCALEGVESVSVYCLGQRLTEPLDEGDIFLGE